MLGLPAPYRTPWQYALHSNRSYTLAGGSRLAAGSSIFHDPPLLPRTIAYTATEQVHQQMPGRSHPHIWLVGIRIRSSTLPRTIAFTIIEQVHQQKPGRSHPHNGLFEYRSGEKGILNPCLLTRPISSLHKAGTLGR